MIERIQKGCLGRYLGGVILFEEKRARREVERKEGRQAHVGVLTV